MGEFYKLMDSIASRYPINQVFNDFMQMSICAFSNGLMEEQYLELVGKYNSEEITIFGQALGALILEYENNSNDGGKWCDILGTYFETINSVSQAQRSGQFFTPVPVCELMARVTHSEETEGNVIDPCSGSGRNLIAHSRLKPENRFNFFYTASDIDIRCVNMSVLNFIMFGLKGVVLHMDSLSVKIWGGYRVYLPETGLLVRPLTIRECESYIFEYSEHRKSDSPPVFIEPQTDTFAKAGSQLSLF
jgi:type I restriction enzyme M protein